MHLVVLEDVARGKVKDDGAPLVGRGEDLGVMRSPGKTFEIPSIH